MKKSSYHLYKCHFPNCDYQTELKSKIDLHHVVPKELNPKSRITIELCKTHHSYIYVPNSKYGQHSIKTDLSLEILGIYNSTDGKGIHYKDAKGKQFYYFPNDKSFMND